MDVIDLFSFFSVSVFYDMSRSGWNIRFVNDECHVLFLFFLVERTMDRYSNVITAVAATRKSRRCPVWPDYLGLALAKCAIAIGFASSALLPFLLHSSMSSAPKSKVWQISSLNSSKLDLLALQNVFKCLEFVQVNPFMKQSVLLAPIRN